MHVRLCKVRLRELGLFSVKKRWLWEVLLLSSGTWGIQRKWPDPSQRCVVKGPEATGKMKHRKF